ncbi:MAG: ABC transporter ATP-binding protein [Bacteroidetes bacterium]|nr:ABC transporter ATP-binding protein [Bacteroidota bacterium]
MQETAVIEVKGVHKSFKTVHAVKGISLRIPKGQFVALLGPNGAGKTTLVEMIEGIQKPDEGEILILGKHWKSNEEELHRILGISLQETRYIDKLTVAETLQLFASFFNLYRDRVDSIIDLIGLEEKRKSYVVNLSGGQRQRLAIGIALLNNPKILLLDEPTTGLDPNARREIWVILMKLKEQSETTMILTTHYMEEAEQLCDYIIIIDQGEILKEGNMEQLLNSDQEKKIVEFTIESNSFSREITETGSPFQIQWDPARKKGIVEIHHIDKELPALFEYLGQRNLQLKNLEFRKRTLDDLFTSLTGRHLHE